MPTSRRRFLVSGVAVTTLAAGTVAGLGSNAHAAFVRQRGESSFDALWRSLLARTRHPLHAAVFANDEALGAAFGAAAARAGVAPAPVGPDVGGLWRDRLEPRLRRVNAAGPIAVAGLTAGAPLFCLEFLARDYGLRPRYRLEHAGATAEPTVSDGAPLELLDLAARPGRATALFTWLLAPEE
jgi:hypothetical protein